MRRIEYPDDLETLKKDYEGVFDAAILSVMQDRWKPLRDELRRLHGNTAESHRLYPNTISELLKADYELLVDIFVNYYQLRKNRRNPRNVS